MEKYVCFIFFTILLSSQAYSFNHDPIEDIINRVEQYSDSSISQIIVQDLKKDYTEYLTSILYPYQLFDKIHWYNINIKVSTYQDNSHQFKCSLYYNTKSDPAEVGLQDCRNIKSNGPKFKEFFDGYTLKVN